MEIKKRLNAAAKRLTPEIESMNVAVEIRERLKRIEELIDYAEQKIEGSAHKKESAGVATDRARREEAQRIADVQDEQALENAKDQQQSDAQPGEDVRTEGEIAEDEAATPDPAEDEAVDPVTKDEAVDNAG